VLAVTAALILVVVARGLAAAPSGDRTGTPVVVHQYLMKARQDDARRAGERDRLLLEGRRARGARRQRPGPATRQGAWPSCYSAG